MKFNKILISLLILTFVFTLIPFCVFASDVITVVIVDTDGTEYTYDIPYCSGDWGVAYSLMTEYQQLDFDLFYGIVLWRGKILYYPNIVNYIRSSDYVNRYATSYHVRDSITITDNQLVFDDHFDDCIIGDILLMQQDYIFRAAPMNNGGYIYYSYKYIMLNDQYVKRTDYIDTSCIYTLSSIECEHDWYTLSGTSGTCESPEILNQECINCWMKRNYINPDFDYSGHQLIELVYNKATCTTSGYLKTQCELCSEVFEETIKPLGHNFRNATCTEDAYCVRSDCGVKGESALGHNLNWLGNCKRSGCSYNGAGDWIDDNISDPVQDALDKAGEGLDDGKEKFDDIMKILSAIPIIFLVMVCLMVIPQIMSFISSWLNLKKHYREYKENKKNKKGK